MEGMHFVTTPWKIAKQKGMVHYISPRPCRNGHYSFRPVNRADCNQCRFEGKDDKEYRIKRMLAAKRIGAGKQRLAFDLTRDNVHFPDYCTALGIPLDYSGESRELNATFDRIDPRKGYTHDNVRVISGRANRIKSDATLDELQMIVNYIRFHSRPTKEANNV